MISIDKDSTIMRLEAIVMDKGKDYVYPRNQFPATACTYERGGEPSCIVGVFLYGVGVPIERLKKADQCGGVSATTLLRELQEEGILAHDEESRAVLAVAQAAQDARDPWGYALKKAKAAVRNSSPVGDTPGGEE